MKSESDALIALVPVFLAVIALANTALIGWLAMHQTKIAKTVEEVKIATNGVQKALGEAEKAKGALEERARAKAEKASNEAAVAEAENKTKS